MQIFRGVYVDSFHLKRINSIYFLTHWHSDHYYGITAKWQYGPIYCSEMTRKILLTKYPKLSQITNGLKLGEIYTLKNHQDAEFKVTMFDSNHIAGSVMILFQVPDKRYILHTGDMRFNNHCLVSNPSLFDFDEKLGEYRCKYQIDRVYLDNTYCDPIFMFPNRSDALKMIKDIIDKYQPGSRPIYIVTDSIGKEEAFVGLSLHYKIPITLWGERMQYVKQMVEEPLLSNLFCAKEEAHKRGSWIEVIKGKYVQKTLQEDQRAIVIRLTGWANLQHSYPLSDRNYIVPYSLHSNYQQLQLFMSVVRPRNLMPVVRLSHNKSNKFRENIHSYGAYFGSLMHMKQRGFEFFCSNYTNTGFTRKSLSNGKIKSKLAQNQAIIKQNTNETTQQLNENNLNSLNIKQISQFRNQELPNFQNEQKSIQKISQQEDSSQDEE